MRDVSGIPDLGSLARDELEALLEKLTTEEQRNGDQRQTLQAQIELICRELLNRDQDGEIVIPADPDFLGPGTTGVREPCGPRPRSGTDAVALPQPTPDDEAERPGQL